MQRKYLYILIAVAAAFLLASYFFIEPGNTQEDFVSYELDLRKQDLQLYWKDSSRQRFASIGRLKSWLNQQGRQLVFAMNGGMFWTDYSPAGLFIQEGKTITPLDTAKGEGNFYLKPNGVFYVTEEGKGVVCTTEQFHPDETIRWATQSGPMLLTEGKLHPAFQPGSPNINIRNGVGVLANGNLLFMLSKKKINFYDFATYFRQRGCRNALYLDGFVSRCYLPQQQWRQTDGDLGVIIGVTEKP